MKKRVCRGLRCRFAFLLTASWEGLYKGCEFGSMTSRLAERFRVVRKSKWGGEGGHEHLVRHRLLFALLPALRLLLFVALIGAFV